MNIEERIIELRTNLRFSQRQFAAKIGKTGSWLSRIESKESQIHQSDLNSIILTFNVNPEWLEDGKGEMFKKVNSNEVETLLNENKTLKAQVSELLSMVRDLTNSVNMLSQKLGKLKGNPNNYTGKEVPLMSVSVTPLAKVG